MKNAGQRSAECTGCNLFAGKSAAGRALGLLGIAGIIFAGCSGPVIGDNSIVVVADTVDLRDGDLLFRLGPGPESRLVTVASRGVYSHVGMAVNVGHRWMAVHAVPGENRDRNTPDTLKCEPLTDFFLPGRAIGGATARIACPDTVARAAVSYALEKVHAKVLFDHHYRMTDTTELYCTELVYLAYLHQGIDLTGHRCYDTFPPENMEWYLFPSDLQNSPFVERLLEFRTCRYDGNRLP